MSNVMTQSVVRQIESLYGGGSVVGLTDRQLLDRFVARRDAAGEEAFAALVARHGPMVLGVCRQLLVDRQHSEDAFQAVFLVLARRARSVRDPDRLSNWLYGIALRTARKARARLARQRRDEEDRAVRQPEAGAAVPADQTAMTREQAETLHEEIDRLPGLFRVPVVLYYFEGLTLDQAAQRLRCPAGTIHSRLARARDRLRRGLTRRGVALPAAALAMALAPAVARASVSSSLCETTTRAAIGFAAGQAAAPVGDGPCPGGSEIHAREYRETLFTVHDRAGDSGHRRGVYDICPGEERRARASIPPPRRPRTPLSRRTQTARSPRAECSCPAACSMRMASPKRPHRSTW